MSSSGVAERGPDRVSPSNRRETSSLTEPQPVGVDRLSTSFKVLDYDPDPSAWSSFSEQYSEGERVKRTYGRQVVVAEGVSAYIGVQVISGQIEKTLGQGAVFGKIEFNPSRVIDPRGVSLATLDQSVDAFQAVLAAATAHFDIVHGDDLGAYRLKRLDVAKDFHSVVSPSALIRGLAPIPRRWARKNLVHADPSRNGAQTLMVGSKTGVARLYDKFAESEGVAPEGTVRCEIEARGDWLVRYGALRTVADLSGGGVEGLGRDRFEWSAMGVEVKSRSSIVDKVAASDLTPREQVMFLGWLVMQATPHAYVPAKEAAAKFRRIQRDLNVSIGDDDIEGATFTTRLDWESGTVKTKVA